MALKGKKENEREEEVNNKSQGLRKTIIPTA